MNLIVEKGFPRPENRSKKGLTEQLRAMSIGDSFLYPLSKRGSIASLAKQAGMKVSCRVIDKNTVRVWRVT